MRNKKLLILMQRLGRKRNILPSFITSKNSILNCFFVAQIIHANFTKFVLGLGFQV